MNDSKKRVRRTQEELNYDVMSAVGALVCEKGYMRITLMDIARTAHADPNVLLRNYGSLEELLDRHAHSVDYWMRTLLDRPELSVKGGREELKNLFCLLPAFAFENESFRRLLQWELADDNLVTRRIARAREFHFKEVIEHYKTLFDKSGIPFDVLGGLIVAGTYALIVRRKRSTFLGVDYDNAATWPRISDTIRKLIDLLFERIDEQHILIESARRFKRKGIDEATIAECTGLAPEIIASLDPEQEGVLNTPS